MTHTKTPTIDMLILRELLENPSVSGEYLSRTWGEDATRCYEWLKKFEKRGLCFFDGIEAGDSRPVVGRFVFAGRPEKIREVFLKNPMKM